MALLTGISSAPWVIKPLYGFLSDTVPIFGYRRRSYLIICGVLGTPSSLVLVTRDLNCPPMELSEKAPATVLVTYQAGYGAYLLGSKSDKLELGDYKLGAHSLPLTWYAPGKRWSLPSSIRI